ncbi:hypothetical protein [Yersinia rohdei]|uniref:hypothetical protein n=1 Tax=Yersinia rohdei TaxID=29485 RepID=UPI0025AADEBC|nr:hypothetical protein [Yersinia rohdei]MDN0096322.1 hypothetical protein [Yersinia rohdei]
MSNKKNEYKANNSNALTGVNEIERNKKYRVKIKNKRQYNFFYWFVMSNESLRNRYLQSPLKNKKRLNLITRLGISDASVIIQEVIDNYFYDNNDGISHYCWKIDEFLDSMLSENEFDWFRKNKDACYFVWLHTRTYFPEIDKSLLNYHFENTPEKFSASLPSPTYSFPNDDIKPITALSELVNNKQPTYSTETFMSEISSLVKFPASHQERYDSIIHFIDLAPASLQSRLSYIRCIREQWHLKNTNKINIPATDTSLCEWAWEYIRNKPHLRERVYQDIVDTTENSDLNTDAENTSNTDFEKGETTPQKIGYVVKEIKPDEKNPIKIKWQNAFNLIQPQTPEEMCLAVNAIWTFYISNSFQESRLLAQFRRARDTYLTRRKKGKKTNPKKS